MTSPQPYDPPLEGGVCRAWAQPGELPVDAQPLHSEGTWCAVLSLASDILWALTGRRWRNVQATETATLDDPAGDCSTVEVWGAGWRTGWHGVCCDPTRPNRVRLPRPDVTAITAAEIGGSAFTSYRRAGNWAVRTDGAGWPLNTGTRITYTFGRLIPPGANLAAILLATELGRNASGKACALPARVTSVVRQGITYDALESLEVLREGLTGLHAVDAWIRAVNPHRTTQQATVWTPDVIEARTL